MNVNHLIRNAAAVHNALMEIDGKLIAKKACKIYVPEHYVSSALGSIDEEIHIVGIYGITVDDTYFGVSRACALMQIDPSSSNVVDINGSKYMEFTFAVNDVVIKNLNLIRTGTLVYRIYNEIIAKGKIPWYFNYSDLCFLFDTAKIHGNADLHADSALLELIASSMARQREDKAKFIRHDPKLEDTAYLPLPVYIPLQSVAFNATTTTSKILGSYFNEGLTSSLVTPTTEISSVEDLLRK